MRRQISWDLSHSRPTNLKKIKKVKANVNSLNETEELGSSEGDDYTYPSTFEYSKYFNDATLFEGLTSYSETT